MKESLKTRIKEIRPAVLLSAAFSFCVFFFAPVEMYLNNVSDVSYDIYDVIRVMLPVFILSFLLLTGVFLFLGNRGRKILFIVLFVTLAASYIQGTFMSGLLSIIDGRDTDWSIFKEQRVQTIAVWVLLTVLSIVLSKRGLLEKAGSAVSCLLALMLLISAVLMSFNGGLIQKKDILVSDDGMLEMSSDRNFVIFVLDSVDSEAFADEVKDDDFPDFTFYSDTVGTYLETKYSVPFIISGQWYEMEKPFLDYQKEAYETSPLLESLSGWDLGMYYQDLPGLEVCEERFSNVSEQGASFENPFRFIKMQLMLSGLKYLPYDLKQFCVLSEDQTYSYSWKHSAANRFTNSNSAFCSKLEEGITVKDGKVFRFILLNGAHHPYVDGSYEKSVAYSIDMTKCYIAAMKEAGVYDNSVIIVMADHGCNGLDTEGRQYPLLMIKGFDEHHPFETSDIPVSFADLSEAYTLLLKGERDIFPSAGDSPRQRRYLSHYEQSGAFTEKFS